MRCPECGYVRPSGTEDAPVFHKPYCLRRRQLRNEQRKAAKPEPMNLKTYKGAPSKTIAGITAKLDQAGRIVAAISADGLRWKSA